MTSHKTNQTLAFLSLALFLACSNHPGLNKNFGSNLTYARSFVVMKPNIKFYFKYSHKDKPKPEYDIEVGKNVQDAVVNVLNNAGVNVVSPILTDSLLRVNDRLAANLERARQQFIKISDTVGNSDNHAKLVLNDGFTELARETRSDYLVFVNGRGYQKPRSARNVILQMNTIGYSRNQLNGLFLEIGVVDVRNGEVVWFNRNHDIESDYDPLHFESVEILCEKLLRNLHRT